MNRRHFLSLVSNWALAGAGGYGLAQIDNSYRCVVKRQEVTLDGLPVSFDGFRLVLMADFHHSSWIPAETLRSAVTLANSLQPDLIALTGDYVHRGRQWVSGCVRELAQLRARMGVVAVLGNHDLHDKTAPVLRQAFRQCGIADLTNQGFALRRNGEELWIGGVGDLWTERQKIRTALAGARGSHSSIILSHNPDYAEEVRDERVGLMLSGHTHGGQCIFPMIGAPILPTKFGQKYRAGLCQGPTTKVFVTTGVGSSFPPVRINCPAEVAVLTLRREG